MSVTIEVDDSEIMAAIDRLIAAGADLTPAMSAIAGVFRGASQRAFANEADPVTGESWADLSDVTKKRRAKEGKWPGEKLRVMGHLANIQTAYGPDFAVAFSPEKYAKTQQFGAKKGQYGRLSIVRTRQEVQVPWGDVPPRPFLGVSDDDRLEILDILSNHLIDAL